MVNPIQVVLDAEVEAQRQVETEAEAATSRITEARQQARQVLLRNEARTTRVVKRYEAFCERDLMGKIDVLVEESEQKLERFSHLSEADRQKIVEAVFAILSPINPEAGKQG